MNQLIVLLESDHLSASLLRGANLPAAATVASNLEQWATTIQSQFGAIGLMQLEPSAADFGKRLVVTQRLLSSVTEQTVFAVGSVELSQNVQELLLFGFTNVFCNQAESERLEVSATRYWNSLHWPTLPLEERVLADLPWDPAPETKTT